MAAHGFVVVVPSVAVGVVEGTMAGFCWASARQVAEAIRGRVISAVEVLAEQLERINGYDGKLGSVVTLDAEGAPPTLGTLLPFFRQR